MVENKNISIYFLLIQNDVKQQRLTANTRLRFASPKLLPSVATSGIRKTLYAISDITVHNKIWCKK